MMLDLSIKVGFSGPLLVKIEKAKTRKNQGFSLKGTKIDQWVKAGTGQSKNPIIEEGDRIFVVKTYLTSVQLLLCFEKR